MIQRKKLEKTSRVNASPIPKIFQGVAHGDARKPLQIDALHNTEPLTNACPVVVNYKYTSINILSLYNEQA